MKPPSLLINFTLCLSTLLCALFGASLPVSAADTKDMLRIVIAADIRSLNPGVKRDSTTDMVVHHIFEGLVGYKKNLDVAPMLAEKISLSEDKTHYFFTLRQGVKFHNGEEVTAEHVRWNWQRFMDPKTRWRCKPWFDGSTSYSVNLLSVNVVSRYEIRFTIEKPSFTFLHRLANVQCFSAIIHPQSVDEEGRLMQPIGTGPYKLKEWRHGEYVDLERFDDYQASNLPTDGYTGKKQALSKRLRFLIVSDTAVAKSALLAGDIDIYRAPLTLYPELDGLQNIRRDVYPVLNWTTFLLQTNDPLLSDPNIRKAIMHAIDRDGLAKYATLGFGKANSSAVPGKSPYHTAAHNDWYEYNPAKTKKYLAQAKYAGEVIKIQTNRKNPQLYDNAIILHSMLLDAGIMRSLKYLIGPASLITSILGRFRFHPSIIQPEQNPI